MLRIGEFSNLTGISIHMLRNYDKIDLLKPERVDSFSNYRFYGEKQIVQANNILVLKSLGFGLNEIHKILMDNKVDDCIKNFLQIKINEKEESVVVAQRQIKQMKQALSELNMQKEFALSVSVKKLPTRKVVSLRGFLREFSEEGLLWERLNKACATNGIKLADIPYCMAMTHSVDFENNLIDTEVFKIIDQDGYNNIGELRFSIVQEIDAAVVAFQGPYSKIDEINKYVYHWTLQNGYRLAGKAFNIYYISPGNELNPENYVTEICYPVKR